MSVRVAHLCTFQSIKKLFDFIANESPFSVPGSNNIRRHKNRERSNWEKPHKQRHPRPKNPKNKEKHLNVPPLYEWSPSIYMYKRTANAIILFMYLLSLIRFEMEFVLCILLCIQCSVFNVQCLIFSHIFPIYDPWKIFRLTIERNGRHKTQSIWC